MAYDEGLAELLRSDLSELGDVAEKKMFGGLCFMVGGHMTCLASADHGMVRVGKQAEAAALEIAGVSPMQRTGRRMPGFVEVTPEALADDRIRADLLAMALAFVRSLPPK
ncbi:TfoX/Sxy family protein [Roseisalinus antarcticus]|uniref:TfoX N-terminal domain-containing protein n=1 Tax=Roseisalinus antarcticus TaxID=254357 RepID=A0A1Y5RCL3_9RHOB|nr:TfoX/Sxy family protein [Roseisalinus antarcticus]SLN14272.1 hypothetical protein ROA7023_00132 [Roseisalinus antarcticus]